MTKVKVGIIGLGYNGRQHAVAHTVSNKSELVALCDRDEHKLHIVGKELGVRNLYRNYDEIMADSRVQAVSIHTPDGHHKEPFLKALKAKKHILVEKPLANTEEDLVEMVRAVEKEESSLKIEVGYILRFNPVFEKIRELVHSQELGQIFYMESDYVHNLLHKKNATDPITGNNWHLQDQIPMVSGGSHCLDLLRWIKGNNPTSVFSYSNHLAFPELSSDDCMASIFKFQDETVAKVITLWAPECPRDPFFNLRIYGTNGTIERDQFCIGKKMAEQRSEFKPIEAQRIKGHPYDPEIDDWLTAIIEDTNVRTNLKDGANSNMATLCAVKAAREGKEVIIPVFK
ncbi:MAG: Gfo/Idh/MocA family oxidoreductase [Kiritimatiellae bacterium]|nr:Gfo/Idh/MocA family oxidoreductase [Kiritimatiellia bacterium]MDD5522571.1 Gfo/Idh/MocA family oxidoreductase [Kiritimatiellia bacterium]